MNQRARDQLPLALTLSRIVFAPILMAMLYFDSPLMGWWSAALFVAASLTDWADGALARRWAVESVAGKFLDPIADKILVLGAIVMLLQLRRVDALMVFLLLGRDIIIGGVRAIAATEGVVIAAKPFGKWKTGMQMTGIPLLLIHDVKLGDWTSHHLGYLLLWVSVALSLLSAVQYTLGYLGGKGRTPHEPQVPR